MDAMITRVFKEVGQSIPVADAYNQLVELNPSDPYKRYKAAGSLGGSSRSRFVVRTNSLLTRSR